MNNFKKDLACNITLIAVLTFSVVHLMVLTLNLFGTTSFALPSYFNYIFAYFLVAISLAFYILCFVFTSKLGLEFPKWLRIMFYLAFFVFTNTYYLTGLFQNILALVFLYLYIGFCISIVSLSLFYNSQKDDKNRLKSTRKFIISSVFMYSVGAQFLFLLLVQTIKAFAFSSASTSTLLVFVIEACSMLFVSIIISICFNQSLKKNKKLINNCLVKYVSKTTVKRSVSEN